MKRALRVKSVGTKVSAAPSMIGSELNGIRRDRSRIRLSRRHFRTYRRLELRGVTDTAGHLSGKATIQTSGNIPLEVGHFAGPVSPFQHTKQNQ
jgi:hypothetical protein